jgi:hypothetical protein
LYLVGIYKTACNQCSIIYKIHNCNNSGSLTIVVCCLNILINNGINLVKQEICKNVKEPNVDDKTRFVKQWDNWTDVRISLVSDDISIFCVVRSRHAQMSCWIRSDDVNRRW